MAYIRTLPRLTGNKREERDGLENNIVRDRGGDKTPPGMVLTSRGAQ